MTKTVWPTGTKNRLPGTSKKKKRLNLTLQNMDFFVVVVIISESENCSVVSDSWRLHGLYSSWNSSAQNTGMGGHSLLQGIFPTRNQAGVSCTAGRFFYHY